MENKNKIWRPVSEYTGGRVLATNGLDVIIGEINSEGDCESEEDGSTILCGITGFIKIEEMLPELKESEDVRIELLNYLYDVHDDDEERARWIAWLEKQGEPKGKTALEAAKEVKVDNQNCVKPADKVEPKFKVGQTIKKEGFNLGFTIVKIEDCFYYNDMGDYFPFTDQDNWELVEQKPVEWSEEDEDNILHICCWLNEYGNFLLGKSEDKSNRIFKTVDWLKSLRPQTTWKPSDEQIYSLDRALRFYGKGSAVYDSVKELLEQLKKLKQE